MIGRDLFIRTVALRAALTLSTALAARRGTIALAGYQIAVQWWTLMAYVTDALEAAAQSLVGRTLGANDRVHARRTARRILGWGLFVGLTLGLLTVVLRSPIAHLFTNEADIIPVVTTSLLWVGAMQPIGSVAYALDGIMVGAGDLAFLARAMIISSVVFADRGNRDHGGRNRALGPLPDPGRVHAQPGAVARLALPHPALGAHGQFSLTH